MTEKAFSFIKKHIVDIFVVAVMMVAVLPLIINGKNSIITVGDNLDQFIGYFKMMKDRGLLFSLSAVTSCGDLPVYAFSFISYNLITLLNAVLDVFTAHILSYVLKIIIGYFSMFVLLQYLFEGYKCSGIIKLVSLAFALLPSIPVWWISVDTVPILVFAFLKLSEQKYKFNPLCLLLIFYPFFSVFATTGIFMMAFWFLFLIIISIKNKKMHMNLFFGFLSLCIGVIIVEFRLFYSIFAVNSPTIRKLINANDTFSIKTFLGSVINGEYHAPTVAKWIIFPLIAIFVIGSLCYLLNKKHNAKKKQKNINKNAVMSYHKHCNKKEQKITLEVRFNLYAVIAAALIFSLFCFICLFLYKSRFNNLLTRIIPLIKGFNWGRFSFLTRTSLYVAFAGILIVISRIPKIKVLAVLLSMAQIVLVFFYSDKMSYNYTYFNLFHNKMLEDDSTVTYSQFFSEKLFEKIKAEIRYSGEKAVALGFHPSVLMYNGFNTLDGYVNMCSLEYHNEFRKIISPAFVSNKSYASYYDTWGARMYIFNSALSYVPTKVKNADSVNLLINADEFKRQRGKYILSRAEIKNANELSLWLTGVFTDENSIYNIYVYKIS